MRPIPLLFLLVATSSAIIHLEETPIQIATKTHSQFDNYVRFGSRIQALGMLADNFSYLNCKGEKYTKEKFIDIVRETPIAGKVLEAKSKGDYVIYEVGNLAERLQIVLIGQTYSWKIEKILCASASEDVWVTENPMSIATQTQDTYDNYIRTGYRVGVLTMLMGNFVYEDCQGKKYGKEAFADLSMATATTGTVLEARADKHHVIYRVKYWARERQFMITKHFNGWYFERGQEIMC